MKRLIVAVVLVGTAVACTVPSVAPSQSELAPQKTQQAKAEAKSSYASTFAVYAAPDAGTCKRIRGYLCKAVVKVVTADGDVAGYTVEPQGKVTLPIAPGTWPITARYSRATDGQATASWCYDGTVTVPFSSWVVLRAVRC